jgi:hypothetical protein
LLAPDDPLPVSVEVKAIGLSDDKVEFCQRMAPAMRQILPKEGLGHIHAPIDGQPPRLSRDQRRFGERQAKRLIKQVPHYPRGLRAATIVGHGSEDDYVRRVVRRVEQAVRQLPAHDECMVAVYWSNGAPARKVAAGIDWNKLPPYISTLLLLGCGVAFPDRTIHCYMLPVRRREHGVPDHVFSQNEGQDDYAKLVLDRFERSSGIRPSLVYGGNRVIIRRDGTRRILPFNLLLDADPPEQWRALPHPLAP